MIIHSETSQAARPLAAPSFSQSGPQPVSCPSSFCSLLERACSGAEGTLIGVLAVASFESRYSTIGRLSSGGFFAARTRASSTTAEHIDGLVHRTCATLTVSAFMTSVTAQASKRTLRCAFRLYQPLTRSIVALNHSSTFLSSVAASGEESMSALKDTCKGP